MFDPILTDGMDSTFHDGTPSSDELKRANTFESMEQDKVSVEVSPVQDSKKFQQFSSMGLAPTMKLDVSQSTEFAKMRQEINQLYNEGNGEQRNKQINDYCTKVNEATQAMDVAIEDNQIKAMQMLNTLVDVLTKNSNPLNEFPELFYETYNNMARCMNLQGDIKQSLFYLDKALDNVEKFAADQEPGSVTIIPEVSLNICNAHIYLKDNEHALIYAERSIESSKKCIYNLSGKLDGLEKKDLQKGEEYQRLYQLFISQLHLLVQAYQAKGQAYERIDYFSEAIREYN
jgi:tetratricopeptide (TPR) repeat protein